MCVSASIHVDYSKAVRVLATDVYMYYIVGLVAVIAQEAEELKKESAELMDRMNMFKL